MKKLVLDPSYDLVAAEKLRFKFKVEKYLRNSKKTHTTCFAEVWRTFDSQLNELSSALLRSAPSECFLLRWEQTTRRTLSGLQRAVRLLDYSVADLVKVQNTGVQNTFEEWLMVRSQQDGLPASLKRMIKVTFFSAAVQESTGDGIRSWILRWYRKEMGEVGAESEKSHLHDLPYLPRHGWKKRKRMEQDCMLLIRCATLFLDLDAPTSTSSYDTLFASPILNHERSIAPEAAERRRVRIRALFGDTQEMGEWKEQIGSLKDQLLLTTVKKSLQSGAADRLQRSLTAGKDGEEDLKYILDLLKFLPDSQGCEAVIDVLVQWISTNVRNRGTAYHEVDSEGSEEAFDAASYVNHMMVALNDVAVDVKALGEGACFDEIRTKVVSMEIVNATGQAANLLSSYLDNMLRMQKDPLSGPSLDNSVKKMLHIYSFLQAKDVFLELHARRLARRIIRFGHVDEGKEREIAQLILGRESEYGQKITRLLADVDSSKTLVQRFNQDRKPGIAFRAIVFSASAVTLPPSDIHGIRLPKELGLSLDEFNAVFNTAHQGRKLTYLLHLSTVELQTLFTTTKYRIQASVPQATILLLFTEHQTDINAARVAQAVGLSEKAAVLLLEGLVKRKLLLSENGEYCLNFQFSSNRVQIPLQGLKVDKHKEEVSAAIKHVDKSRLLTIEAAVVRVMKCSKELTTQNLVTETISAVRGQFKPVIKDIDNAVRALVEKGFLSKNDGEPETYTYVA
ncbi:hypothetical protein BT69DRAFT_1331677 [Atractiella rhizophila]|nr:hypothetical protein BT69DRAFT_1331677 [Atractiella rhizophila]